MIKRVAPRPLPRARREKAIQLTVRLIETLGQERTTRGLQRLLESLERSRPRQEVSQLHGILMQLPGDTIEEKRDSIGVTHHVFYRWLRGQTRPDVEVAERIAKLTGYPVEQITGGP